MEFTLWLLCVFTLSKTLWLLYVYVRDFCDGITFLGKVHFCVRKRLPFFILAQNPITFTENSTETHKNISESTKNIATAVNKRLAPLWVCFYFGKFSLKIKFGYICDVSGKMPQRQAKRRDVVRHFTKTKQ
jgi:hypothetical protein